MFLLEEDLELLHEQSAYQLVFSLFEDVKPIEIDLPGNFPDYSRVDAAHIDLELSHFFNVGDEELYALIH